MPGLRPAEPGEFTRRAFLNGRLDLTAVEGLADLVDAETRAQARQALRQLDGALGRLYGGWREALLGALARLEAEIDFAPEEDVPDQLLETVRPEVRRLSAEIAAHLADGHRGERLRAGLTVAVVGPPNAGKSSLVNRLARRDVAIVTPLPGTTRDVLEVHLDLAGYPVTLLDTAGLREAADLIEAEGVRRARSRAEHADVRLIMFDGAVWPELDPATLAMIDEVAVIVVNKCDLAVLAEPIRIGGRAALPVSCLTGEGIAALLEALAQRAAGLLSSGDEPLLTRARHRAALQSAAEALARFTAAPDTPSWRCWRRTCASRHARSGASPARWRSRRCSTASFRNSVSASNSHVHGPIYILAGFWTEVTMVKRAKDEDLISGQVCSVFGKSATA